MSFLIAAAAVGVASGVGKIIMANQGRKERIAEQAAAKQELEQNKAAYENLDTSNAYANLENKFEDITVNQQQAQFEAQQNQQNQANIMQNMQGAAGGSGIASLAQAMANQGQMASQKASASIGMQEAQNQKLIAGEASKNQQLTAAGEQASQQMTMDKTGTLLGMSQQRKAGADAARAAAKQQMMEGVGQIGTAAMGAASQGAANMDAGKNFLGTKEIKP
tara:strand:- start:11607 stop:12269 length:663 start_codon:yes stop_codon:yes gene_type:complete